MSRALRHDARTRRLRAGRSQQLEEQTQSAGATLGADRAMLIAKGPAVGDLRVSIIADTNNSLIY